MRQTKAYNLRTRAVSSVFIVRMKKLWILDIQNAPTARMRRLI